MHYALTLAGFTVGVEQAKCIPSLLGWSLILFILALDAKLDATTEALNNILISAETWNKLAQPKKKEQPEETSVLNVVEEQPVLTMKSTKSALFAMV